MTQGSQAINSHIEDYLDYYCGLSHAPGFAVLLKGQWGSGKTWFINRYREKLKEKNQKCLYISLYGMTDFSEIEYAFFQQLHPILSSKGMAITSKIFKGFLKGTLKIDLNNDSKDDGTVSIQIPDINLPDYLRDTDKSILIFDDLERCKIDINNLLGYINHFVEHQELKVILIANEDELVKNELIKDDSYRLIKEKLIGKTFGVSLDFEGALEYFIARTNDLNVQRFLSENVEVIQDLYQKAEYENLRNLRQIILDFERIFEELPNKVKEKPEILQDILKRLMAFSVEIKRGEMMPRDIGKLEEEYMSGLRRQSSPYQTSSSNSENNKKETSLQKILSRYTILNLHDPFPSTLWWQTFFDKGIIDKQELEQSILSSRYFQTENTPDWVKLWHFSNLSDDDFDNLLMQVDLRYAAREFIEFGEIKHIFGLFLTFSNAGIYAKSKEEILKDSKDYIDYLKNNNQLDISSYLISEITFGSYRSLGFQGKEFEEFQEFSSYINKVRELARTESIPNAAQELLVTMQSDVRKFYRTISLNDFQDENISYQTYHETPVLQYIKPDIFVEKLLSMQSEDQQYICWALKERYRFNRINEELVEELKWLESIRSLLLEEASSREGKISGFTLKSLIKYYLDESIQKFRTEESQAEADK